MEIFQALIIKLIPLYFLIGLGFLGKKLLSFNRETIALLLIYIINPVVFFDGAFKADLNPGVILLPVIIFCISCLLCGLFYFIGGYFWKDSTRNLMAYTSGVGNTGYFGLPVALMLFGDEIIGTFIMALFGFTMFENTLGFFVVARGSYSLKKSILKVASLPSVYTFFLGIMLNCLGLKPILVYQMMAENFRGAYTVLGMMIVGMALNGVKKDSIDPAFFINAFVAKFLAWPLIILFIIWADNTWLFLFSETTEQVLLLLSVVPMAANTVTLATVFKSHPEKASFAVFCSTIFSIVYIPLFVAWFF